MPKRDRDIDNEPANEELVEAEVPTVGDRLKAAREKSGLSLEDVAAQTRIPQRHLESIEAADWDKLPAPTYTVGFAKSYASAVGLDRSDVGDQLREEMGGQRFTSSQAEVFEPADPARTMPKWLVVSAIVAIIVLVVLMSWLNRRALDQPQPAVAEPAAATAPPAATVTPSRQVQAPAAPPAAAAQGPVTLTATAPAWVRVTDQGKTLFEATMQPGQTYQVPQTAVAPTLRAGAPEALRITVGNTVAPPVGPAGQVTSNVSLKGPDLMRGGASAGGQPGSPPPQ
ncbi:MAG TPA: RodZ domain-containing protein [Sphingomicrobium sp.]|nr:RodZ domain-containing protein [Sphingomicrobium sp.]